MKTDPPQKGPRTPQAVPEGSTPSETEQPTASVAALDGVEKVKKPHSPHHAQPQRPALESPKGGPRQHHRDAREAEDIRSTPPLERLLSDLPVVEAPKAMKEPGTLDSYPLERISASSSDEGIEKASGSDDEGGDFGVLHTPLNVYFEDGAASEVKPTARLDEQADVPSLANQLVDPEYRTQHGLDPIAAVPEQPAEPESGHLLFVPAGYDRTTGLPPRTTPKFRQVKPNISLATSKIGLWPNALDMLGLQVVREGQKKANLDFQNPLLVKGFYGAICANREWLMKNMSTAKIGIKFKDNAVPPTFWIRIKHKIKGVFKSDKLTVRGDVAFMLRTSH